MPSTKRTTQSSPPSPNSPPFTCATCEVKHTFHKRLEDSVQTPEFISEIVMATTHPICIMQYATVSFSYCPVLTCPVAVNFVFFLQISSAYTGHRPRPTLCGFDSYRTVVQSVHHTACLLPNASFFSCAQYDKSLPLTDCKISAPKPDV